MSSGHCRLSGSPGYHVVVVVVGVVVVVVVGGGCDRCGGGVVWGL